MTVITLTTTAPGYQPRQEVMKPHYRRNVTLTIDIPLAPMPTNSRGSRKDGRGGGRGITERTERSESTERGLSDFRGFSGSVVQRARRLMGWCMSCMG